MQQQRIGVLEFAIRDVYEAHARGSYDAVKQALQESLDSFELVVPDATFDYYVRTICSGFVPDSSVEA
jgi:hypothetical protein